MRIKNYNMVETNKLQILQKKNNNNNNNNLKITVSISAFDKDINRGWAEEKEF